MSRIRVLWMRKIHFGDFYPLVNFPSSSYISHDLLDVWILIIQTKKKLRMKWILRDLKRSKSKSGISSLSGFFFLFFLCSFTVVFLFLFSKGCRKEQDCPSPREELHYMTKTLLNHAEFVLYHLGKKKLSK